MGSNPNEALTLDWTPRQPAPSSTYDHWIFQDGKDLTLQYPGTELERKDRLARAAENLSKFHHSRSIWWNEAQLAAAWTCVLHYAGYRVYAGRNAGDETAPNQFQVHVPTLHAATKGSTLYPDGFNWVRCDKWWQNVTGQANLERRREYARENPDMILTVLDLKKIMWRCGARVAEEAGFFLPYSLSRSGDPSPLQRTVRFMRRHENILLK